MFDSQAVLQGKQYILTIQEYRYLNGNPDKENTSTEELTGILRIYKAKRHYFAVGIIGNDGTNELVKKFFDSFNINQENNS